MSAALWSQEKPSGGFWEDWRFYMVIKECTVKKPPQKDLRIPRGSLGQSCQERNSLGRTLPPCKGKKSLRILDQSNVVLSLDERDVLELDGNLAELLFPITSCEERYSLLCNKSRLERTRHIACGSKVRVQLRSGDDPVPGVVRFKGSLLPDRAMSGIWFGVELLEEGRGQGFTEGSYQGQQLFRCEDECGVFVALDKLDLCEGDDEDGLSELDVGHVGLVNDDQDNVPLPPLEINSRVLVQTRGGPERGTIIFCDLLPGNESLGYYVGVDMDNPIGDWDGVFDGRLLCNFATLEHTRLVPICDVTPNYSMQDQRLPKHSFAPSGTNNDKPGQKPKSKGMAGVSCVLSEDQFLCSICLEVFTDPVTTACGHSFCNICINKHWDNCVKCLCPVCKEEFSSRPQLKTSTVVLEMVSEFKNKPQREDSEASESEAAGAGDVLCDVCPEPKLKALKSCLVCQTSYCPDHLTPHNTVPRLKKHQLIAPVENLEERICPEHGRLIDSFCRDDSQLICLQCLYSEHRDHSTVPLKEQCEEEQSELQQKIQERRQKIHELQRSVELSQENADREMKTGEEFFTDLMKLVQESLNQFKQNIKEKHEEIKEKGEELMRKLKSEISALEQRRVQMEEIFRTEDHFHLIQTFALDKPAPELNDWSKVSVRAPSFEGRLAVAVSDLWLKKINPKIKELFEDELESVKEHAVDVTLDPGTAHPHLDVLQNDKQVTFLNQRKRLPDTPERFSNLICVLGKQKFSSGKFYYDVQVKEKPYWYLGVASESIDRKAESSDKLTPQNGYWQMIGQCKPSHFFSAVEKVGVFVNYEEGLICFFDAKTSALIHSLTDCCFTGNILPLLCPCVNRDGNNSAPLILTPVHG